MPLNDLGVPGSTYINANYIRVRLLLVSVMIIEQYTLLVARSVSLCASIHIIRFLISNEKMFKLLINEIVQYSLIFKHPSSLSTYYVVVPIKFIIAK